MRRSDSEMQQKIEALIQEEADPRERARLLILYQIAAVLVDNVAAVRETTEEFRQHRVEYESHVQREAELLNQGRGMWKVGGLALIVAQSVLGYLYYDHMDAVRSLQATVVANSKEIEVIAERHRIEDRTGMQP